jgi:hypothetical protein
MAELKTYTDKIFHRVHRTGEELKNDLPNWIERAIETEVWKQAVNPSTGKAFENAGQWLVANYPLGPAVGNGRFAIDYEDCINLCKDRPEIKDLLVRHRPKQKAGGHTMTFGKRTFAENTGLLDRRGLLQGLSETRMTR